MFLLPNSAKKREAFLMVEGSVPNWKPRRRGTPGSPSHLRQALGSQDLGTVNANFLSSTSPSKLLVQSTSGDDTTLLKRHTNMESYRIFEIRGQQGQKEFSCLGKSFQSRPDRIENALWGGREPWDCCEEKQPGWPAEAPRERSHFVGNTGVRGGKRSSDNSSANNSLLKNKIKLGLWVWKGGYGRCQEKKLRAIHMFQLNFIIKPILLSLQLTSDKFFWPMFVSEYFIFGTFCVLETVL